MALCRQVVDLVRLYRHHDPVDARAVAQVSFMDNQLVQDMIIVDTPDALLVCAKDSAGDIKKVLEVLRAVNRTELL